MLNIAVLVSGGGTNLQAILEAQAAGKFPDGQVALVVASRADAYALQRAANFGVPRVVVAKKEHPDAAEYDKALLDVLQRHKIGLVVLAGFMTVLGPDFINAYRGRILNVHPSLIPAFCGEGYYGLRVHREALARGVKVTGATVHLVNEICDGGPILLQKAVEVLPGDTPEVLQRRVMEQAEWVLLPQAIALMCEREREGTL